MFDEFKIKNKPSQCPVKEYESYKSDIMAYRVIFTVGAILVVVGLVLILHHVFG